MKIIIDREGLRRRARLSHSASLGGLLTILASVAVSLWRPACTTLTTILLFLGFSTAVVGIYYANRWVKKPRPETALDQALIGLNDRYRLYHYTLPCDHVLLMPNGLVVLETCNLEGQFTYRNGKWRQKITAGRAMRFFVEEKLGDPITRAQNCASAIKDQMAKNLPEGVNLQVHPMVVFTNSVVELNVEKAEVAVCRPDKLRRKIPKNLPALPTEIYQQIRQVLDATARQMNASEQKSSAG